MVAKSIDRCYSCPASYVTDLPSQVDLIGLPYLPGISILRTTTELYGFFLNVVLSLKR